MSEFNYFYGIPDDWQILLQAAISTGLQFYVDDWYANPILRPYAQLTEEAMEHIRMAKRRVFLSGQYTTQPLVLDKQSSGQCRDKYFIDSTRGGITIALTFPAAFERAGKTHMQGGSLHLQSEYWNAENTESQAPGDAAKLAYSQVVSNIKALCKVIELTRKVWVAPAGYEKFMQDSAVLNLNGLWLSRTNTKSRLSGA